MWACATECRSVDKDGLQTGWNGQAVLDTLGRIHQVLQSVRAAGALRRLVVDGLADVERTDPVTAGMQQVLRFGQTVRRNLEFGLDDSPAPGVGRCVADAAEERQAMDGQQPLAQYLLTVPQAQAHGVYLQRVHTARIVQAVSEAGREDVGTFLGQQQLAARRPSLTQVREDHQLQLLGCHAGGPFRNRVP